MTQEQKSCIRTIQLLIIANVFKLRRSHLVKQTVKSHLHQGDDSSYFTMRNLKEVKLQLMCICGQTEGPCICPSPNPSVFAGSTTVARIIGRLSAVEQTKKQTFFISICHNSSNEQSLNVFKFFSRPQSLQIETRFTEAAPFPPSRVPSILHLCISQTVLLPINQIKPNLSKWLTPNLTHAGFLNYRRSTKK